MAPTAPDPRRGNSSRPGRLVGNVTKIKRQIAHSRISFHRHGHSLRAAGDDLPVVDYHILAIVSPTELWHQVPECPTLAFPGGFRGLIERQIRGRIFDDLAHDFHLVDREWPLVPATCLPFSLPDPARRMHRHIEETKREEVRVAASDTHKSYFGGAVARERTSKTARERFRLEISLDHVASPCSGRPGVGTAERAMRCSLPAG